MGLFDLAKRLTETKVLFHDLCQDERKFPYRMPLAKRLEALRYKLLSESYIGYHEPGVNLRMYLNDWERYMRTPFVNGEAARLLNDKLLFERVVSPHSRTPRVLGWVYKGRWLPTLRDGPTCIQDVLMCGAFGSEFVLKLRPGAGGRSITMLSVQGNGLTMGDKTLPVSDLPKALEPFTDHLLTPFIHQAEYSHRIFPQATNTLRVLSLRDPQSGNPFLAGALHRFGTTESAPLDNVGRGGIWAEIDLESGRLGRVIQRVVSGKREFLEHHPQSKQPISGVQIPFWPETVQAMLSLHKALPMIQYVGWDLVIAEDGPWILEGNNYSGIDIFQVFGPLLADERVLRFFQHHRVVRRKIPEA